MSKGLSDEENPYRSPADEQKRSSPLQVAGSAGSNVLASRTTRGFLKRRIRLSGGIEADLEWIGDSPVERIRVNGTTVASQFALWYCPKFQFDLERLEDRCQITVEIRLSRFAPIFVRGFRIIVNGTVVYLEGQFPETVSGR